jgi:hypothetical protein
MGTGPLFKVEDRRSPERPKYFSFSRAEWGLGARKFAPTNDLAGVCGDVAFAAAGPVLHPGGKPRGEKRLGASGNEAVFHGRVQHLRAHFFGDRKRAARRARVLMSRIRMVIRQRRR